MKRYIMLFLAGLLLSLSGEKIYGQSASKEFYCPNETGKNVILRTIKDHPGTFMYTFTGQNRYFYHNNHFILNTYKFTLPVLLNQIGGIAYTVNDMDILGEEP